MKNLIRVCILIFVAWYLFFSPKDLHFWLAINGKERAKHYPSVPKTPPINDTTATAEIRER